MNSRFSNIHQQIYLLGLAAMVVGLPLSHILMSTSQMLLGANWFIEGNYKEKLLRLWNNKPAVVVCSIFLLHLLGMTYSSDWAYGLNDLRIKAPLFILPFIISTSQALSKKQISVILEIFTTSVLIGTVISMSELVGLNNWIRVYFGYPEKLLLDIRDISLFISHIRFSLLICLAIFFLYYRAVISKDIITASQRIICIVLMLWMVVFLIIFESVTGLSILLITSLFLLARAAWNQKNKKQRLIALAVIISVPLLVGGYLYQQVRSFYHVKPIALEELDEFTIQGNRYTHDFDNVQTENGYYCWIYVCTDELSKAWELRSEIMYLDKDKIDQHLEYTLIRYLTSKGFRKDEEGLNKLSNTEIRDIENGCANALQVSKSSIAARIYGIIWEFNDFMKGGSPGGHSVTQRLEFWKTSVIVMRENFLVGVGTGDIRQEVLQAYEDNNSKLKQEFRHRPHNQYLSIGISFGIFGLMWFVFSMMFPLLKRMRTSDYLYLAFLSVAMISMLTEDTLETQAGATFFAFFNAFLLFGRDDAQ